MSSAPHNITRSDTLAWGSGMDTQAYAANRFRGVDCIMVTRASLGTPAVADADYLLKAATSTELPNTETVTYTPDTDGTSPLDGAVSTTSIGVNGSTVTVWDVKDGATYGRNLVCVATHSSSVVAMTIVISGYDYLKKAMTQSFSITAGTTSKTATGTKAFAYVSSIAITAAADAEANTLNIGTGSALGLPYKLAKIGDVVSTTIGGVQELINVASNATFVAAVTSTASATTGDVRGTVTHTTALDGSKEPIVFYYVSGRNSAAGIVGVTQA